LHIVFLALYTQLLLLVLRAHERHIAIIAAIFEHGPPLEQQYTELLRSHSLFIINQT